MSDSHELIKIEREKRSGILDLGNCNLERLPAELFKMDWLETLNLSSYYFRFDEKSLIWDRKISSNANLENKVNMDGLAGLGQLKKLRFLYISAESPNYGTADFSFLEQLHQLECLFVNCAQALNLAHFKELHQLKTLSVRSKLNIRNFQLVGNLRSLRHLSVSCREVENLDKLADLADLTALDLHFNKPADFDFIGELAKLESLELRHNRIGHLGFVKNLKSLKSLDVRFNQIAEVEPLRDLQKLRSLMLTDNKVKDLTPITHLIEKGVPLLWERYTLNSICVEGNPVAVPPQEVVNQGNAAVLRYFESHQHGADFLYEAKVIVLGETGVGKTSLRHKLVNILEPLPEADESTSGIDIVPLKFPLASPKGRDFSMNIWDFGGQEIYHNTHQFFLTKRSVYVLVVDYRIEKEKLDYWMQLVELLGDNSPLLIFHNEKDNRIGNIDYETLLQRYGGFVREQYVCNLKLLANDKKQAVRFQHFRDDLQLQLRKLPHIGEKLPSQWIAVREEINRTAKTRDWIPIEDFYGICKNHKITERIRQEDLSQYFHDLGVFLHFQSPDRPSQLSKIVILNKEWATKAVYEVLDSQMVMDNRGRFSYADLRKIWENGPYLENCDSLLELMRKFELCYAIEDTTQYITPQLLPAQRPKYQWNRANNLTLKYSYDFMPKGIITRLIVRLHRYIADNQQLVWHNGVVFEYRGASKAEVVETYGKREIEIRVSGKQRRDLLSIIVKSLDELNGGFRFNEKNQVRKLVPCNCPTCLDLDMPHFFDESDLQIRFDNGKMTIECNKPPFHAIQIPVLLQTFAPLNNPRIALEQSKELIAQGEVDKALQLLMGSFADDKVVLLSSQFRTNDNLRKNGVRTDTQFQKERNRITEALLDLIPSLYSE